MHSDCGRNRIKTQGCDKFVLFNHLFAQSSNHIFLQLSPSAWYLLPSTGHVLDLQRQIYPFLKPQTCPAFDTLVLC